MSEELQEYVAARSEALRVDTGASVLRGVKLLGLASRNGRTYREEALAGAIPLYEGAKVNVNHPAGDPLGPRDYRDRLGVIRNVALEPGAGLFGDLHFNPKHALAEQLVWDAVHASDNLGLSHNVLARTTRTAEGEVVVEEITKVQSIDVVADPAATRGLFEAQAPAAPALEAARRQLIAEVLRDQGLPSVDDPRPAARRLTSPCFVAQLAAAATTEEVRALAADRAALAEAGALAEALLGPTAQRATSREQRWSSGTAAPVASDWKSFLAAVTH